MSAQKPDGAPPPSPDPRDQCQRDGSPADAEGAPTAAATPTSAATSSRMRRLLPAADLDDLVGTRRRVQMQLGGARSGMARAAAVASRTAGEEEERRKRRREQKNASDHKRRKAADNEADNAASGAEAGESEVEGDSEGEGELADLDDGTDLVEQRHDERRQQAWLDAGCPGLHRSPPPSCPHGKPVTDDWISDEGYPAANFSSRCGACLVHQVAVRACEAVVAAAAPDDPPDPEDPWGGASADCFYDNGSGDPANRRLAGGLSFALPDEVYGPAKHGGPPERERERKALMGVEEREPDWASWASRVHGVASKSGDYYYKYDARAEAGFVLMRHNAFADPLEVYRWLDEPPPVQPPLPPPTTTCHHRPMTPNQSLPAIRPSALSMPTASAVGRRSIASARSGTSAPRVASSRGAWRSRTMTLTAWRGATVHTRTIVHTSGTHESGASRMSVRSVSGCGSMRRTTILGLACIVVSPTRT